MSLEIYDLSLHLFPQLAPLLPFYHRSAAPGGLYTAIAIGNIRPHTFVPPSAIQDSLRSRCFISLHCSFNYPPPPPDPLNSPRTRVSLFSSPLANDGMVQSLYKRHSEKHTHRQTYVCISPYKTIFFNEVLLAHSVLQCGNIGSPGLSPCHDCRRKDLFKSIGSAGSFSWSPERRLATTLRNGGIPLFYTTSFSYIMFTYMVAQHFVAFSQLRNILAPVSY